MRPSTPTRIVSTEEMRALDRAASEDFAGPEASSFITSLRWGSAGNLIISSRLTPSARNSATSFS